MKSHRSLFLYFILFCFSSNLPAQDTITEKANENRFILVKMNLLSLVDYTPSVQFSLQYNIYERFHIQHEIGYINHFLSPFWNNESKMSGFRIKNQLKYYITPTKNELDVFYMAADIMYKKTCFIDEKEFGMYDFAYFQRIKYEKTKEVIAVSLILGFEPVLKKKLIMDFFGGFGFRHLSITDDLPPDLNMVGWNLFRRNRGNYNMPGLCFGFRIGYKFNSFF